MTVFFIKAFQLILALLILVLIHEFGHFFFARLFGMKVDKFYIFFNPWVSLFKWKPGKYVGSMQKIHCLSDEGRKEYAIEQDLAEAEDKMNAANKEYNSILSEINKVKRWSKLGGIVGRTDSTRLPELEQQLTEAEKRCDETKKAFAEVYDRKVEADGEEFESQKSQGRGKRFWKNTMYGIGWLPLGGYCKISGMIDESMDTEQMKRPAQPWEFRSKPAWQRLLVMVAGVLFNFLLAIVIYAGIVYFTGEKYVPFKNAEMGMAYSEAAKKIGFKDGDIPVAADGKELDNPATARMDMLQAAEVTVSRQGRDTVIKMPEKFIFDIEEETKAGSQISFLTYRIPVEVTQVVSGQGADKAGIETGDRIIAINGIATPSLDVFFPTLDKFPSQEVTLTTVRNNTDTIASKVQLSEAAKMGVGLQVDPSAFFKAEEKHYNLFQAVPRGVEKGIGQLTSYAESMKLVFTKEGAKSVGGFGALGSIFPEKWNWIAFWNIAAFISVALAFMNILPVPGLDGGHILFLLYEVITRRKPGEKFMEYAQMTGMFLLLLLLLYANGMDIVRLFAK